MAKANVVISATLSTQSPIYTKKGVGDVGAFQVDRGGHQYARRIKTAEAQARIEAKSITFAITDIAVR